MSWRPAAVLLSLWVGVSCTLQERADIEGRSGATEPDDPVVVRPGAEQAADSVRSLVASLREALRQGDVSRVGQLTVSDVVLVDQEAGVRWSPEAGESDRLPRPLLDEGSELAWVVDDSSYTHLGDGALLVNRYHATVAGEDVPWTAVETFVAVRTPDGWRIRWLHRSRGGGEGGGGP